MNRKILAASVFFLSLMFGLLVGYIGIITYIEKHEPVVIKTEITETKPKEILPLSWEKEKPNRKKWSEYLYKVLEKNIEILDMARDIEYFCPNYIYLEQPQRINVWGEIFSAMSFYESRWNPTVRNTEQSMSIDPVTNQTVVSEGLLQVGYLDSLYHKCDFDWERDSKLEENDANKTTLNPYLNLACGVKIMTNQISKHKTIAIDKGAYWAVIKIGHRNSRIPEIIQMVSNFEHCKLEN